MDPLHHLPRACPHTGQQKVFWRSIAGSRDTRLLFQAWHRQAQTLPLLTPFPSSKYFFTYLVIMCFAIYEWKIFLKLRSGPIEILPREMRV